MQLAVIIRIIIIITLYTLTSGGWWEVLVLAIMAVHVM